MQLCEGTLHLLPARDFLKARASLETTIAPESPNSSKHEAGNGSNNEAANGSNNDAENGSKDKGGGPSEHTLVRGVWPRGVERPAAHAPSKDRQAPCSSPLQGERAYGNGSKDKAKEDSSVERADATRAHTPPPAPPAVQQVRRDQGSRLKVKGSGFWVLAGF